MQFTVHKFHQFHQFHNSQFTIHNLQFAIHNPQSHNPQSTIPNSRQRHHPLQPWLRPAPRFLRGVFQCQCQCQCPSFTRSSPVPVTIAHTIGPLTTTPLLRASRVWQRCSLPQAQAYRSSYFINSPRQFARCQQLLPVVHLLLFMFLFMFLFLLLFLFLLIFCLFSYLSFRHLPRARRP